MYSKHSHFCVKRKYVFSFRPFEFASSSGDWKEETETAAAKLSLSTLNIPMSPGISKELNITAYDDLGHKMDNTILEAYSTHKHVDIVTDDTLALEGKVGSKTDLVLLSVDVPVVDVKVSVDFVICPPAYTYNYATSICQCNKNAYFGISECINDNSSRTSSILSGVWAGYVPSENDTESFDFVTSSCLFGFCNFNTEREKALPVVAVDSSNYDSVFAEVLCAKNRMGMHCSRCRNGTSVFYHSSAFPCWDSQTCSLGWFYFILSDLLPLTFVFVVISLSGMTITSGLVQGLVLFSHLVSVISISADGIIQLPETIFYSTSILWGATYGLINMKFLHVPGLSFCLYPSASPISLIAMRYIITAYALILVFLVSAFVNYCIPRYRCLSMSVRYTTTMTSIVNGLSALLVLSFANCMETSMRILHSTTILGEDLTTVAKQATFMDSNPYMQGWHLFFAVPAIVFLVLMLIPATMLLMYPIFTKVTTTMEIEESRVICLLSSVFGYSRLKPFYDLFYHSFKDDYRSFAGLYLFYRVIIQLPFFVQTSIHLYYTIELVLIAFLAVHAIIQPYANSHHNMIDAVLFTILVVVNGMTCFNLTVLNYMKDKVNQQNLEIMAYAQMTLVSLPMVVAILYVTIAYILVPCYKKCRGKQEFQYDPLAIQYGSMDEREDISLQESFSIDD